MSSYSPKRALFDSFAEVAKALSHGSRLEILERSEEHTSELQSPCNLVCRLLLEKKKTPYRSRSQTACSTHNAGTARAPRQKTFAVGPFSDTRTKIDESAMQTAPSRSAHNHSASD